MHSSPPSAVDIAAAARALDRNAAEGDLLRRRLASRIGLLRGHTADRGLHLVGGLFPLQATPHLTVPDGRLLLRRLAEDGVHAVLRRDCAGGSAVALAVTATHRAADVRTAAAALAAAWPPAGREVDDDPRGPDRGLPLPCGHR
jgi:8-amino-7-oxononanoate synthase